MIILQFLGIIFWLAAAPAVIGAVPAYLVDRGRRYPLLPFVCGYLCMWAAFQCVTVPFVLLQKRQESPVGFPGVVWVFGILMTLWVAGSVAYLVRARRTGGLRLVGKLPPISGKQRILWGIFAALLFAQVLAMIFFAFADGDDAYYTAVAAITEESNTMYVKPAYTGGSAQLDLRYGLAPMPVWIAFLGRMTGFHTATVAHIFAPVALLLLTYGIYATLGQILCRDKQDMLPVFLTGTCLLVLFGNYSFKTAETFLITRTSQGKSVLGNVILPALFLLLFLLLERVKDKKPVEPALWLLFMAAAAAACLCSSLGGVLVVMLMGIAGFYTSLCYKKAAVLGHLVGCCLPALLFIALYLWIQGV